MASPAEIARDLIAREGGRFSTELGIDVDAGEHEVERWFLASTLFGSRISTTIAIRTFGVLEEAGMTGVARAPDIGYDRLVQLLDRGGYVRYDFRTARRLLDLAGVLDERFGGSVGEISRRHPDAGELAAALDALPGWGPVTVRLFLRELRGVWPGAEQPTDPRAEEARRRLGLPADLDALAGEAGVDRRDLEAALVRLDLGTTTDPFGPVD